MNSGIENFENNIESPSFDHYFQEELTYMREMGKVFSDAYPMLAPFLGKEGNDPDVERLLEGFSFIASRIRQQLDGTLANFAQEINQLVWPQLQRPIPSFSIAQFLPLMNNVSSRQTINSGSEVTSVAVQGTQCKFSTCYDVNVFPLFVKDVSSNTTDGISTIEIILSSSEVQSLEQMDLQTIRFYINTSIANRSKLYQLLFSKIDSVGITLQAGQKMNSARFPAEIITPVGYTPNTSILPITDNSLFANQLLLEYFCFPEKHLFFDINIGELIAKDFEFETLTISIKQKLNSGKIDRLSKSTFLLHCTPMANLFDMDANPIELNGKQLEYSVSPACQAREHYNIYSIDSVLAIMNGGRISKKLAQLHSLDSNDIPDFDINQSDNYYQLKIRSSVVGGIDNVLLFHADSTNAHQQTTISTQLTCTNHDLPAELKLDDIVIAGTGIPATVNVTNITIPTKSISPDIGGSSQWQMLSNISSNFLFSTNEKNLKLLLSSFNISAKKDRYAARDLSKKIDSISRVECRPITKMICGTPVHGYCVDINVNGNCYLNEGDMYIFFDLLYQHFTFSVDVNTFCILKVTDLDTNEKYSWGLGFCNENVNTSRI